MAEICVSSSSQSAFLLRQTRLTSPTVAAAASLRFRFLPSSNKAPTFKLRAAVSDPTSPSLFTVDSGTKGIVIEPEIGGGDGGDGGDGGEYGGRGGGDGGGGGGGDGGGEEESGGEKKGMSMSQKLTLAYALLVGVGGVMGFLKSGSNKSLLAGGISASLLFLVYTQLPKRTVFASSIGLGLSAALLVVMGSRFKRSGKIFPAGVVSLVSLVMTGGYLHGIMRGMH